MIQSLFSRRLFGGLLIATLPMLLMAQPKPKTSPKTKATTVKSKPVTNTKAQKAIVKNKPTLLPNAGDAPFQLLVHAKGFKDSTTARIVGTGNIRQFQGATAYIKNEQVVLQGAIPQGDVYLLILNENASKEENWFRPLYLENQPAEVNINRNSREVEVVSGEQTKTFNEALKTFGPDIDELNHLGQLKEQYQSTGQPLDSLNRRSDMTIAQINQKLPAFVLQYPSSPVSSYMLATFQSISSVDQLQRNLDLLKGDAILTDQRTVALKEYVQQELYLAAGKPAPEFTQTDTVGKPVSLSSFKGKYVLVDFWASWCGPCRMENPNVVRAYNEYKAKNFTVLGVSLDRDKNKWLQAIHDDGLQWTHVSDLQFWSNAVAQQYRIQSIPQNLLIGPDGKIIAKNLRGGVLDAYLKDLLK